MSILRSPRIRANFTTREITMSGPLPRMTMVRARSFLTPCETCKRSRKRSAATPEGDIFLDFDFCQLYPLFRHPNINISQYETQLINFKISDPPDFVGWASETFYKRTATL
jgi:hypothetical protein